MKKTVLATLVLLMALPLAAETWKNVSLMDASCSGKADLLASPEKHTKHCAMQCVKSGYGAVVDGKFVKFDKHGSELAAEAIKKTDRKDNLRADVTGELKNGEIVVTKFEMAK
ncbi:MAG TPA: hypothetical protein VGJ82_05060 [Thermoanaerobaculia bacterium]|jgi:hypothetical protein